MAASDELTGFVKEGLVQGLPRRELETTLLRAGWRAADVRSALGNFADLPFPIPVPRPRPYVSARDAFLYLVLFSTLYVAAFNLGSLLFHLVDVWIPDPASSLPPGVLSEAIRWSISALIVAAPVFLYVSALTGREIREDAAKRSSKVRRWLTYMTLFVAAAVLIGDVTALVYSLLGGELTIRFALKAGIVAAIAGTGFSYYLGGLRADEREGAL